MTQGGSAYSNHGGDALMECSTESPEPEAQCYGKLLSPIPIV